MIPRLFQSFPSVRLICLLIASALLGLLAGCGTPEGGTSLPWNRPATWEKSMPMGTGPGAYTR